MRSFLDALRALPTIRPFTRNIHQSGLRLAERDLVVDKPLRIVNPFRASP